MSNSSLVIFMIEQELKPELHSLICPGLLQMTADPAVVLLLPGPQS